MLDCDTARPRAQDGEALWLCSAAAAAAACPPASSVGDVGCVAAGSLLLLLLMLLPPPREGLWTSRDTEVEACWS